MKTIYYTSPIGSLEIVLDDDKIKALTLLSKKQKATPAADAFTKGIYKTLDRYFDGTDKKLDLPLQWEGTDFNLKVWRELKKIPFGKTLSYGEIARKIGKPKAFRAVGTACGRNPYILVVPCHRVLAANGKLGGFSAGIHNKVWLHQHEGIQAKAN